MPIIHTTRAAPDSRPEEHRSMNGHRSGSLPVVRRLAAELAEIKAVHDPFEITPDEDSITQWSAIIEGPEATPYAGGRFVIDLSFPIDYPFSPPRASFRTPIFHPNIAASGPICLDLLKRGSGAWSPLITVPDLLRSIQSLLNDPNPDDPLNVEAADLLSKNLERFRARASDQTKRFAKRVTSVARKETVEDPYSYLQVSSKGEIADESSTLRYITSSDR